MLLALRTRILAHGSQAHCASYQQAEIQAHISCVNLELVGEKPRACNTTEASPPLMV